MADVNFIVEIAVANPFKFTLDGVATDERADFDQRRYADVKNASVEGDQDYAQPVEKADTPRVQFYSNYPLNRIRIIDCDDVVHGSPMTPSVIVQYRNKKYRSACKFASIDGKLFIYFIEGLEYQDEDFSIPGELVALNGVTPNINALPGDIVRFSINGGVDFITTTIDEIVWNPSLQAEGYLTDLDYTILSPIDGLVEITYNEKPANLIGQLLDLSALPEARYFVLFEVGVSGYTKTFRSEPLDIRASHPNTLALDVRHDGTFDRSDLWNYVYESDWTNRIRLITDFYRFVPAGEVEADTNDNATPRVYRARPYRQLIISFINMPSWLADKVQVALSHDKKVINGYEWEIENYGQFEMIDQLDLGTYEVNLRQKNDRTKRTNTFTESVTAAFDPNSFTNIDFSGDVVTAEFQSNTPGVFRFASLPSWITTDVEEFSNGDIVEFTIAANATFFERSIQLIAVSDDFDGLQAPIDFQQDFDESAPEFIDAAENDVELDSDGDSQDVNVSASGPWEAINQSGFSFDFSIDGDVLTISKATPNGTSSPITGVIRVRLVSNPAVFEDINVTQLADVGLTSVEEASLIYPDNGGTQFVDVTATPGTQWQAVASQSWVIVDSSLQTGSQTFTIFLNGRDLFIPAPRFATVTFININNPSNTLVVNIQQN